MSFSLGFDPEDFVVKLSDTISRSVRTLGIGVQSGDTFTIGVRIQVQDNS